MDNTKCKSKAELDISDMQIDDILTQFAEEEKKKAIIKIDDSDDEFDSLIEDFANAESDSEDIENILCEKKSKELKKSLRDNGKFKSKYVPDIDDEILTEFAAEEKKCANRQIDDSDDEFDCLIKDFTNPETDSESEKKKSNAKVILSLSDDEIDDLLEEFEV